MAAKRFSISNFLKSNWVITLTSTMFGVIIGLYLTNSNEARKLREAQQTAFEMVKRELAKNQEALEVYDSISRNTYKRAKYVFSKMTNQKEIFIPKDSIDVFKTQSGGIINDLTIETATDRAGQMRVRGEMDLTLHSKLTILDLNDVIWESYKQTDFLNVTNFECVTALEEIYQFQESYNDSNRQWVDGLVNGSFLYGEDQLDRFMMLWKKSIKMSELLLRMYEMNGNILLECE